MKIVRHGVGAKERWFRVWRIILGWLGWRIIRCSKTRAEDDISGELRRSCTAISAVCWRNVAEMEVKHLVSDLNHDSFKKNN